MLCRQLRESILTLFSQSLWRLEYGQYRALHARVSCGSDYSGICRRSVAPLATLCRISVLRVRDPSFMTVTFPCMSTLCSWMVLRAHLSFSFIFCLCVPACDQLDSSLPLWCVWHAECVSSLSPVCMMFVFSHFELQSDKFLPNSTVCRVRWWFLDIFLKLLWWCLSDEVFFSFRFFFCFHCCLFPLLQTRSL